MAQDVHHDAHQPFENVCLTGPVVIGAFLLGLAITAVIFVNAFWVH